MSPAFLLMLIVVVPFAMVLGFVVGHSFGRQSAERDLADLTVQVSAAARVVDLRDEAGAPECLGDEPTTYLHRS